MQKATPIPTTVSEQSEGLEASALRAEAWYGEPFLHPDEDPVEVLAPGTARRAALDDALADEEDGDDDGYHGADPGASRRYRFRHPTASGKTIAAAGFVEASRHLGILILTHRRLLVSQFTRDLTTEGYGARLTPAIEKGA